MKPSTLATLAAVAIALAAPNAFAQKATAQVISIDSDDAEDQADAFTAALKSRARATPGWTLNDATNSLGPLLTTAKCPKPPDAPCLGRIGDQLKVERYFWGTMVKAGKGSVTIDLHYWSRGNKDQSVKETFSDNLKEPSDDALRKVVGRLFERLTGIGGTGAPGGVTVHIASASDDGVVLVDGKEVAKVEHGQATVEVLKGHHDFEVRTADGKTARQSSDVTAETTISLQPVAAAPPPPPPPSKPFPVRKVLGFSLAGLGLVAGVIGIVEGVSFLSMQSKNNEDHNKDAFKGIKDFCSPMAVPQAGPNSTPCQTIKDAETARALEFVFFGIGAALIGTGFAIVITDPGPKTENPQAATSIRLVPSVGKNGGGVGLVGTF